MVHLSKQDGESVHTCRSMIERLVADRRAVTALEYALIAGLIAVVIIGSVTSLGNNLKGVLQRVSSGISSA